jgi:SAM-dependent methyltransferase
VQFAHRSRPAICSPCQAAFPLAPPAPRIYDDPMPGRLRTEFDDACEPLAAAGEVAWYAERLPRDAGPVLDAICGSGRLLVPLAERGFHVHGADASAARIAACEARLARSRIGSTLFRQDVSALNLPFRYGAAFIAEGGFQRSSDDAAARRALARLRAHLVDPALLLLDLRIPDVALHPPGAPLVEVRSVRLRDGARITQRSETLVSAEARHVSTRSRYEKRTSEAIVREDESYALTWYDEKEIVELLIESGYRDIGVEDSPRSLHGERTFAVRARANV